MTEMNATNKLRSNHDLLGRGSTRAFLGSWTMTACGPNGSRVANVDTFQAIVYPIALDPSRRAFLV